VIKYEAERFRKERKLVKGSCRSRKGNEKKTHLSLSMGRYKR
jgi:hypothetical protein